VVVLSYCSKCGREIEAIGTSRLGMCPSCGLVDLSATPIQGKPSQATYCQYCGRELPIDASFCSSCGSPSRPQKPTTPLVTTHMKATSVEQVRKPFNYIIAVILIFSLFLNVVQYSYVSNFTSRYDQCLVSYRELETKYSDLYDKYNDLTSKYQTLTQEYSTLSYEYEKLKHEALVPPYCSISGGEIKWVFYDLKRDTTTWTMSMDTYRYYVSMNKPVEMVNLRTVGGTVSAYDMRPYIQPSFFRNTIVSLTSGRSDREFVKEVDNVKNQIIVYGTGIGMAPYRFPAETLTEGRGVCSETTILMASMLIEGNRQEHYNFKVYVWYVKLDGNILVSDEESLLTKGVLHAIVEVEFSNGESWSIETTTNHFYVYSQAYTGWRFEVTNIDR